MSFLQNMPFVLVAVLLGLTGALLGSLINLGIYQLCYFRRPLSPWSKVPDQNLNRNWPDRIPILGWLRMRRESESHGKGFWLRPMMIEIGCAVGLVAMYVWYASGGLICDPSEVSSPDSKTLGQLQLCWFMVHATLFALMMVATFIDFDERTIPDWITIPGTVFALVVAWVAPQVRLPVVQTDLVGKEIVPLQFFSPNTLADWHHSQTGVWIAILIVAVWCFALLPKVATFRKGAVKFLQFFAASLWPRPRKTTSDFRIRERGVGPFHWMVAGLAFFTALFVVLAWWRGGEAWDAVFGALLGMAFGGGLTWAVRIIAGQALGTEAMGFGDVTLMIMIGAFLGWQPALLVFAFAPFASIVVAIVQLIVTRDQKIAFGPYLCISAVVVVIGWYRIWNQWAADGIFSLGSLLLGIIGVSLLLMGGMLFVWGTIKNRMFSYEDE